MELYPPSRSQLAQKKWRLESSKSMLFVIAFTYVFYGEMGGKTDIQNVCALCLALVLHVDNKHPTSFNPPTHLG